MFASFAWLIWMPKDDIVTSNGTEFTGPAPKQTKNWILKVKQNICLL